MGYRASFLTHSGGVTVNSEDYLHALDRILPDGPLRVLICGVGNGGEMQIWHNTLPEGSLIHGIDTDRRCLELDLEVAAGDVHDRAFIRSVLTEHHYNIVVDRLGVGSIVWPWLDPLGLLLLPDVPLSRVTELMQAVPERDDSWLPTEEVMCVTWFPNVTIIEKRNPLVVPYLRIMMGSDTPIVNESEFDNAVRVSIPDSATAAEDVAK